MNYFYFTTTSFYRIRNSHFLLVMSFALLTFTSSAQTRQVFEEWASSDGVQEYFYKNVTTTDAARNVYVAGATLNSNGDYDLLVSKFDQRGEMVWTDTIAGSTGGHDFATALAIDNSGNTVLCGSVSGPGSEGNNMLVVKYDHSGTELWRYSHDYNNNNEA